MVSSSALPSQISALLCRVIGFAFRHCVATISEHLYGTSPSPSHESQAASDRQRPSSILTDETEDLKELANWEQEGKAHQQTPPIREQDDSQQASTELADGTHHQCSSVRDLQYKGFEPARNVSPKEDAPCQVTMETANVTPNKSSRDVQLKWDTSQQFTFDATEDSCSQASTARSNLHAGFGADTDIQRMQSVGSDSDGFHTPDAEMEEQTGISFTKQNAEPLNPNYFKSQTGSQGSGRGTAMDKEMMNVKDHHSEEEDMDYSEPTSHLVVEQNKRDAPSPNSSHHSFVESPHVKRQLWTANDQFMGTESKKQHFSNDAHSANLGRDTVPASTPVASSRRADQREVPGATEMGMSHHDESRLYPNFTGTTEGPQSEGFSVSSLFIKYFDITDSGVESTRQKFHVDIQYNETGAGKSKVCVYGKSPEQVQRAKEYITASIRQISEHPVKNVAVRELPPSAAQDLIIKLQLQFPNTIMPL